MMPMQTPHVDQAWAEELVLELRLRDVVGGAIGNALAEVESHCAESGEPASEAFGDPTRYARSLTGATEPGATEPGDARTIATGATTAPVPRLRIGLATLTGVLGMMLGLAGFDAWRDTSDIPVSGGDLLVVVLAAAAVALVLWRSTAVLTAVVRRPVLTWVVFMAAMALMVGASLLLDRTLFEVPLAGGVGCSLVLLAASVLLSLGDPQEDPVRRPAGATSTRTDTTHAPTGAAAARWLRIGLFPLATALMVGFVALLG